jgi:hypothetical protein
MFQTFEEFIATSGVQIPVLWLIINLIITGILAFILSHIYVIYGTTLSNRKMFGRNFILIAMTTMLIITIVKSSLALSLGLVGALSIIRFRAAIKEPEELSYLFIAISVGLGFGANQGIVTCLAFGVIILAIIFTKKYSTKEDDSGNLHLSITSKNPKDIVLNDIIDVLKKYCTAVSLKRLDESVELIDISFSVDFEDFSNLNKTKEDLQKLDSGLRITILDSKTIF